MTGFLSCPYSLVVPLTVGVTFVDSGAVAAGLNGINVPLPAGMAVDDIMLLILECDGNGQDAYATPAGWTSMFTPPETGGTPSQASRLTMFWRRVTGGDTDPVAVAEPTPNGDHALGRIIAFRGCINSGDPWDVLATDFNNTASTSATITGLTTTVANTMIVSVIASSGPDAVTTTEYSAHANADLVSITEAIDNTSSNGNGGGINASYGIKTTAGIVGSTTLTMVTSSRYAFAMIALKT